MPDTPITDLAEMYAKENRELRAELTSVYRRLDALELGRQLLLGSARELL